MSARIVGNLRAVEGVGNVQTRVEDVVVGGDVAFATVCTYDTIIIFDVGDPANPADDIIFNDAKESLRVSWEMHRISGTWLRFEGTDLEKLTGEDLCAF